MHFSAKCNSGRIAIQWFHIRHYLDYQYTKFQRYTFRVQKMCVFARHATLVPRLFSFNRTTKPDDFTALYKFRLLKHFLSRGDYKPSNERIQTDKCQISEWTVSQTSQTV